MPAELLTRDQRTKTPVVGFTHPAVSPPGLLDRLRDSYWIAWTFTLFFNWVAFFWIGFRARNRRWLAWGIVYAVPDVVAIAVSAESQAAFDVAFVAWLVLCPVSIAHALAVRRTYIAQRRALSGAREVELEPVDPSPAELDVPRATEESSPQEPSERGLGGLIHRGIESVIDPCHVERARALLGEGRQREALAVLQEGLPAGKKSVARDWYYSGKRDDDLAIAQPALEELAQVRALAREVVDDASWRSWDDELVAGFEALAAAAEREAEELRSETLARSDAKRRRIERRRFDKAMALCAALPLLASLTVGFGAPEGAAAPSIPRLVAGFIVVPLLFGGLSALATWRLWRRASTSDLLYAPFWVGYLAAALLGACIVYV